MKLKCAALVLAFTQTFVLKVEEDIINHEHWTEFA